MIQYIYDNLKLAVQCCIKIIIISDSVLCKIINCNEYLLLQLSIPVLQNAPVLLISLFLMIWFIGNVVRNISNIVLSKPSINVSSVVVIQINASLHHYYIIHNYIIDFSQWFSIIKLDFKLNRLRCIM